MFRQLLIVTALIGLAHSNLPAQAPSTANSIKWHRSPATAFAEAESTGRPVVVFVATDWCHYCKVMQRETWSHPTIAETVSKYFVALQLDGDRDQAIVAPMQLSGYPATLVYTPQGTPIAKHDGMMTATKTYPWLADSYQAHHDATQPATQIATR